jgi:hypothetical protein
MKKRLFIRVIRLAPCAIRDIRDPRVSFSFVSSLVAATLRRELRSAKRSDAIVEQAAYHIRPQRKSL